MKVGSSNLKLLFSSFITVFIFVFGFYFLQYIRTNQKQLTYNLQSKCGKDAELFYLKNKSSLSIKYENYYNEDMNKCFIVVKTANPTDHGGGGGTHTSLYDTNSNVLYAELWETQDYPISCTFNFLKEKCSSLEDFNRLTQNYINYK